MYYQKKKAHIMKLVLLVLVCSIFCNFVLSESCSEYQYLSCSGDTKVKLNGLARLGHACESSFLQLLLCLPIRSSISYRAFLQLMWFPQVFIIFRGYRPNRLRFVYPFLEPPPLPLDNGFTC